MKLFNLSAIAFLFAFGANVCAQPATPATPADPAVAPATPAVPAKGIKITKITGTVNIMKDGQIVMTLKPGDAIPEITDNKVTFAIVDGTVEVEAGGKKISAATGSNFTVSSTNGQTNVALGAGTPVAVKTESGNNIILTSNSEVKMVTANGKVQIAMEKGNAVVTNASGGETQTVTAGQAIFVTAAPMAPVAAPVTAAPVEPVTTEPVEPAATEPVITDVPLIIPVIETPPTTVIPTEVVQESGEVSASNP
ncbi:MAG: hypothetical protein PHV33_11850 [Elusimicrobiales bacterium]|nr:hypothetical protein [Elusimicrobiales bacterium]